jgi:copper chaperone CopZ
MKSVIKVGNMRTIQDIGNIRNAISNNEGVLACQVNKEKQEVDVVYDTYFVTLEDLIASLEDMGYTVI